MNARQIVLVVVLLIVGAAIVFMSVTTGGVGTVTTTDQGVTRVFSKVSPSDSVSVPLTLQEGSDVVHESEHVFEAIEPLIGVSEATIRMDGTAIDVRFASNEVAAEQIAAALAAAGYTAPKAAP